MARNCRYYVITGGLWHKITEVTSYANKSHELDDLGMMNQLDRYIIS